MKEPPVTVMMSVYNGMPYLPEAVESILGQTLSDLVFLIIDDGSKDGSLPYLQGIRDPRVQVIPRPHEGLGPALNFALSECKTEFVAHMDSDDIALPRRLEVEVQFLRDHPEVGMVGSQFCYFYDPHHLDPKYSRRLPLDHGAICADLLQGRMAIQNGSLVARTELRRRAFCYKSAGTGQDWDMWLHMAQVSKLANVDETLYLYRIQPHALSMTRIGEQQLRIAYANACFELRGRSLPEPTFEEFCAAWRSKPFWTRVRKRVDWYALAQYRRGLAEVLSSRRVRGHLRLFWASVCSPTRACDRILRICGLRQPGKK